MKYIDAEKLIAEIEALKRRKGFLPLENTEITEAYMARGIQFTCDDIMNIVTSLQQEQPEVELEKAARYVYESWMGGTMDDVRRDMVELGKVLNARKEG